MKWDDPHPPEDVAEVVHGLLYGQPHGSPLQYRTCEDLGTLHDYLSKLGRYFDEWNGEPAEHGAVGRETASTLLKGAAAAKTLVSEELRDALRGIIAASQCPLGSPEYEQCMQRFQEMDDRFTAETQPERDRLIQAHQDWWHAKTQAERDTLLRQAHGIDYGVK